MCLRSLFNSLNFEALRDEVQSCDLNNMIDKPKDLMEAKTQRNCFRLNPNFSLQQPERSFATLRGTCTLSVWERLTWTEAGLDLEMVATFLAKVDRGLSTILPKFPRYSNVFNDDIFHHHKVNLGNCHQWSRYLVAENRRSAEFSAAPISSERKDISTGLDVKIRLANIDLGEAEKEKEMEDKKETGLTERKKAEILEQETCKLLPKKEKAEQDERDPTVQTDEMTEEAEEEQKDKSIRRRILNWLNEVIHNYYRKKIAETYRREQEEGHKFYPSTFYFIRPMTRADRERQKREIWLDRDNQRQSVKKLLDSHWEEKRKKKEALRIKEEERYEKWMAELGLSVSTSPPDEPKKRMSRWEKRFLRAKVFFY